MIAASRRNRSICMKLIRAGANIEVQDEVVYSAIFPILYFMQQNREDTLRFNIGTV